MADTHGRLEETLRSQDPFEGRYRLGETLGVGSYGLILRAVDERTGRDVAIKVIPPKARQRSETAVERFRREMKIIRRLDDPNIIAIDDWGSTDRGLIYMVLEYVEGRTLAEVVGGDPMDPTTGIRMLDQIASALQTAHDAGVVHRDLKPTNIMIQEGGDGEGRLVKVLDFGLAKVFSRADDASRLDLTAEGMAVGTPRYIAPEQAMGKEVGPSADLYTVGLLTYEIFTGLQAVPGETIEEVVDAHVSSEPLELAEVDRVPERVRPVLWRLLRKDPTQRIQTAGQLREALRSGGDDRVGPGGDETDEEPAGVEQPEPPAQGAAPSRRPGLSAVEAVEVVAASLLAVLAFMAVGARASGLDFGARLAVGVAPVVAGVGWAILGSGVVAGRGSARRIWIVSLVVVVGVHLLGANQLATELTRNPTWFVGPLEGLPGIEWIETGATWMSRRWAGLIFAVGS